MEEEFRNSTGYPSSEIINATDTPRTSGLKFVRAKRLAYFTRGGNKNSPGINNKNAISLACKCSSLDSVIKKEQNQTFRLNDFKETKDEKSELPETKFSGIKQERVSTNSEGCTKVESRFNLELDYSLLENVSVPEIQKLKYVMNWAQEFLIRNREEEHVQKSSTFPELMSKYDGHIRESNYRSEETRSLHTCLPEWMHSCDLSTETDICYGNSSSINLKDTEKCISRDMKLFSSEYVNTLQNEDRKEKTLTGVIPLDSRDIFVKHTILSQADAISITQNNDYFWVPLEDNSDDEHLGTEVKTNKIKFDTDSKDFTKSKYNPLESEGKHSFHLCSSMFESSVPRKGNMASTNEEWNGEKKHTSANNEHMCRDFKSSVRSNNPIVMQYAAGIKRQHKDRPVAFPLKNNILEDVNLDLTTSWGSTDHRYKPAFYCGEKTYRTYIVKHLTEKEGTKSGASLSGFDEYNVDNQKDQRQIDSKKDPFFHGNSSVLVMPSKDILLKVCPKCSSKNSLDVNWCTECGCVLIGILPHPAKIRTEHVSEIIQNSLGDDYIISKAMNESSEDSMNTSDEISKLKTNASDHKMEHWEEDLQKNSGSDSSVLEKYYFYLNKLNMTKNRNQEVENQSSYVNEFISFSKEDRFSKKPDRLFANGRMSEQDATKEDNISDYREDEVELFGHKNTEVKQEISHLKSQEIVGERSRVKNGFLELLLDDPKKDSERKITRKNNPIDRSPTVANHIKPKVITSKRHWEKSSLAWSSYTHGEVKPRSQYLQRPCSTEMGEKTAKGTCQNSHPTGIASKQLNRTACQDPEDTVNKNIQEDYDIFSMWLLLPEELWISIFSFLSHKELSQAAQVCHRFQQLTNDETLWRKIQIANCNSLNDEWLISIGLRHPQSFTLYRCHGEAKHITDGGLTQFFCHCKDLLKELNITNCSGPGLRGDTVLLHASAFCIHLTSVDISWTAATDAGVIALAEASLSLQSLSVNGCKITDDVINVLIKKHKKSLNKLEVFGCHALTAKCMSSVASECSQLQILNIGRVPKVNDVCLAMIASCLEKLTMMNVTGLNVVRDQVVHNIVKRCPKLESLTLSSCLQVTDVSLIEISTYLQTIRYLDVSGCKKVTDIGIQALSRSCYQLTYLDLSSTETGRRGISLLASYCCSSLECLKISFCKEVTADVIENLCKNCKRLKILHLYGCCITFDLKSIKEANKNLKVFHDLSIPINILEE